MPPGDPLGGYAATRHMHAALDWQPTVSIADGVARYTDWQARTAGAIPGWLRAEGESVPG